MGNDSSGSDRTSAVRPEQRDVKSGSSNWIGQSEPTAAVLPEAFQTTVEQFLGTGGIDTLGDVVAGLRRQTDSGPLGVEDLCHADTDTEHWGVMNGETYHFQCFYDALVLSELADTAVEIRTKSPQGSVIRARWRDNGELTVDPTDAVMSFGIDERAPEHAEEGPTVDQLYAVICPYVKAFADRTAYETWAETADAVTVGIPFSQASGIATRLVEPNERANGERPN